MANVIEISCPEVDPKSHIRVLPENGLQGILRDVCAAVVVINLVDGERLT